MDLSIIVPTLNEKDNILPFLERLEKALGKDISWEVVFVDDDSYDLTANHIRTIAQKDTRVRCLQRIGRRGLSSACIEGMLTSSATYLAVMDADLQHDESILPEMFEAIKNESYDIVVGSRYADGGSVGSWGKNRFLMSRLAIFLGSLLIRYDLKDPMSGFFILKRPYFENVVHRLSGKGYKILLDILSSSPEGIRFKEVPYTFRTRNAGESKLNAMVLWEYAVLCLDKTIGRVISVRFLLFVMVGFCGAIAHLVILGVALKILGSSFTAAQTCATYVAMTSNFIINNLFTYHDRKLSGPAFIKGLCSFYLICSIGAVVNIRIAYLLYETGVIWWLSGLLGAVIGAVWNYAISSTFTWSEKKGTCNET